MVRKTDDYIPKMIELAGGKYVFDELSGVNRDSKSGSVTMSAEEFYAAACDADILIYNGSIDAPLRSIDELIEKDGIFASFSAVQNGRVYTTDRSLYQATDQTATVIRELYEIYSGDEADLSFFRKVL